ncbi:MAG: Na/Pi cotransporter family protein [Bacteroidota bacterium]
MTYTLFDIIKLIGAVGFFIYGMKVMSEGIQKIAGNQMRRVLNAVTSNRIYSFFSGFFTTLIVQASSATTVMVVGFTHAGLLRLRQAIGVIVGANVGTTVKALLWAAFGFTRFDLAGMALPVIAVAFPMMFSKKQALRSWSEFLIGFAILFMALDFIKLSVPQLSPDVLAFVTRINDHSILSALFFVLLGTIVTVVIQSSSAAFALTMVLCNQGVIDFEAASAIVLGENIGTTVTANIAAIVANIHGKRAALAHTMHNVLGVLVVITINPFFLEAIDGLLVAFGESSPLQNVAGIGWGITVYHIAFNVISAIITLIFLNQFERFIVWMLPAREGQEDYKLEYVVSGFMKTPELALLEAYKEVEKVGKTTAKLAEFSLKLLEENNRERQDELYAEIKRHERITDKSEKDIERYLSKLAEDEISPDTSFKVRNLLNIISDLERIGDIYVQMTKVFDRKREARIYFLPDQRESLKEMFKLVGAAFQKMQDNLETEVMSIDLKGAKEIEQRINATRNRLKILQQEGIENGDFSVKSAMVFAELYTATERIGDHILKISEAAAESRA